MASKKEVKEEIPEVAISQEETNEGEEEIATEEVDNAKEETALDASLETEEKEEEEETLESPRIICVRCLSFSIGG